MVNKELENLQDILRMAMEMRDYAIIKTTLNIIVQIKRDMSRPYRR